MDKEKIAVLGGGSPFVPGFIDSIIREIDVFSGSEICLMDLDPSNLPILAKLGESMTKKKDVDLKITYTTDKNVALKDATFALATFRVGGIQHLRYDCEIPTKYGIYGDETAGPGGTFMAQCTIPAILDYCYTMEKLCPDAWLISYVNPTNFIADAVRRVTDIKILSLCDGAVGLWSEDLPDILGVPREYIKIRTGGLNHNTWVLQLMVKGKDGYPLLKKRSKEILEAAKKSETEIAEKWRSYFFHVTQLPTLGLELLEIYGYLPVVPTHMHMYWIHDKLMASRPPGWRLNPQFEEKRVEQFRNFEMIAEGKKPLPAFGGPHGDFAIRVIASIADNRGEELIVNVPNMGAISNLPSDAIVEVPAVIDSSGARPLCVGDLPRPILGITLHLLNWQELTVDAALSGDKNVLFQALLACPYVHSIKAAEEILKELLVAHAQYMPQFKSGQ